MAFYDIVSARQSVLNNNVQTYQDGCKTLAHYMNRYHLDCDCPTLVNSQCEQCDIKSPVRLCHQVKLCYDCHKLNHCQVFEEYFNKGFIIVDWAFHESYPVRDLDPRY